MEAEVLAGIAKQNPPKVAEIAKCPVCGIPDYLYQISYPGSKEYVPPRCNVCYEKMMLRRRERMGKNDETKQAG